MHTATTATTFANSIIATTTATTAATTSTKGMKLKITGNLNEIKTHYMCAGCQKAYQQYLMNRLEY